MGLDKAKSLLTVKGADTFLDLTAKQVRQSVSPALRRHDTTQNSTASAIHVIVQLDNTNPPRASR